MLTKRHWQEPVNRRKFLDSFAEQRGFDPLLPENWYSVVAEDILKEKVGRGVKRGRGRGVRGRGRKFSCGIYIYMLGRSQISSLVQRFSGSGDHDHLS